MNGRLNPFAWSIGLGRWSGVDLRVSWLQPVIWLWLWYEFGDFVSGTVVFLCLSASLLLHEIGHVVVCRRTGGSADSILLWPLGGLASLRYAPQAGARVLTAAAGPLVNLVIVVACLPYTVTWMGRDTAAVAVEAPSSRGEVVAASSTGEPAVAGVTISSDAVSAPSRPNPWNPLVFPISRFGDDWPGDLQLILFSINWMLLLVNLIPASPLDGYDAARGLLEMSSAREEAPEILHRIGLASSVVLLILASLFLKSTLLVGLSAMLLMFALLERISERMNDGYDDSFLGYDFSEGYTSLERSEPTEAKAAEPKRSLIGRWKEKRKAERERREREEAARDEADLDQLLAKVHEQGMQSLTAAERRQLERVSVRLRDRRST